jgi:hypothetical protein
MQTDWITYFTETKAELVKLARQTSPDINTDEAVYRMKEKIQAVQLTTFKDFSDDMELKYMFDDLKATLTQIEQHQRIIRGLSLYLEDCIEMYLVD